ncbi:ribosome small subunit-dependent GTPase A [Luteipulveratus halotolerans]|uniref:ribosome small subunit-dependent GTPase A n=1 Tax=Luteipulveratus halotolerans TaxID=1631356 RepID=UPI000AE16A85|nr:ribosome small subunit-dependent GTPase A [Luteipulveratus halotolerans]
MTDTALRTLGWDAERDAAFASYAARGLTAGRVGRVDRGRFEVLVDRDGALTTVHAHARTSVDGFVEDQPATGDWVALDADVITEVLPRRTLIMRSSAGKSSAGQVMAVNVDTVLIAVPLEREAKVAQLERFVTVAWQSGARPLVALTKADLVDADEAGLALTRAQEVSPGVDVVVVSASTGEGLDALRARLGTTAALVGQSGAGKSTLVNALAGSDVMATQATRQDGKGRHTTTARELVALPGGGVLIDTPGLRGVGVHDANDGVAQSFSDIETLADQCRFADCAHESEPGCAVRDAVETGTLAERRIVAYRKQLREVERETRAKHRARR